MLYTIVDSGSRTIFTKPIYKIFLMSDKKATARYLAALFRAHEATRKNLVTYSARSSNGILRRASQPCD